MSRDLDVMVDGFRALVWLDEHSDQIGLGGTCRPCSRFTAALLHGAPPKLVVTLRCETAQAMQQQVDAAIEIVQRLDS